MVLSYSHSSLKLIHSLSGFDTARQADRFFKTFGPGSAFEAVRKQTSSPKQGCWTNSNIKIFLAKREEGEEEQTDTNSKDPDGLVRAIGVVGMYHGHSDMEKMVEYCVRVTQVSGMYIWR